MKSIGGWFLRRAEWPRAELYFFLHLRGRSLGIDFWTLQGRIFLRLASIRARQYGWNTYVSRGEIFFNRCWMCTPPVVVKLPRRGNLLLFLFLLFNFSKSNKKEMKKREFISERHGARCLPRQRRRIWLSSRLGEGHAVHQTHRRRFPCAECRHARRRSPVRGNVNFH